MRERVIEARAIQRRRFAGTALHANAQMGTRQITKWCRLDAKSEAMLGKRDGGKALEFAEQGLKEARAQNNRDAEQQFLELTAAARKLTG